MKEFFIDWSEAILKVVMVVLLAAVPVAALVTLMRPAAEGGGLAFALGILLVGWVYVVLMGGVMFIMFGIYRNTERTNALLQDLLNK